MPGTYGDEQGILHADVSLDGNRVDASLNSTGVLQWRGMKAAGRLSFQQEVLGFRVGASTITLYSVQSISRGCLSAASKKRADVHIEFNDDATHSEWATAVRSWFDTSGRPKRLLVLINPKGGQGKAQKLFAEIVSPMFLSAGIQIAKQETAYYRHASDVARDVDLSAHDGIVCVSGDGVIVEVLNGLLQREDWQEAVKLPIGVIPAGSGNGMAKSLLDSAGEDCDPISATFAIIKGNTKKLDVATMFQGPTRFHSLLNITWGFVSDVDVESEKYRWMGGFRLTFQTIIRVFGLRQYGGRISYLPADAATNRAPPPGSVQPVSGGASGVIGFPGAEIVPAAERAGWREAEGDFVLLWLQNVPWAAEDMRSHPVAELADGCLDMMIVRQVSRWQLLNLFLQMDKGLQLRSKHVEYLKVRAIRMEPGGRRASKVSGGYVNIDGEVLARGKGAIGDASQDLMSYNEPFEVTIQQGLATVYAPA